MSKASSDMMVGSYQETYGLNLVITHYPSNNDLKLHGSKLIQTIIKRTLSNGHIPIYSILDEKISNSKIYEELATFVVDSARHDRCYAMDTTKPENKLGWKANEPFDIEIVKAVECYLEKYKRNE